MQPRTPGRATWLPNCLAVSFQLLLLSIPTSRIPAAALPSEQIQNATFSPCWDLSLPPCSSLCPRDTPQGLSGIFFLCSPCGGGEGGTDTGRGSALPKLLPAGLVQAPGILQSCLPSKFRLTPSSPSSPCSQVTTTERTIVSPMSQAEDPNSNALIPGSAALRGYWGDPRSRGWPQCRGECPYEKTPQSSHQPQAPHSICKPGPHHAGPLLSGLRPPELWEVNIHIVKPPGLWCFICSLSSRGVAPTWPRTLAPSLMAILSSQTAVASYLFTKFHCTLVISGHLRWTHSLMTSR